ncbi:MAG: hypothetical protein ABWY71_01090 [Candidatus Saccharimonadales bacterium]
MKYRHASIADRVVAYGMFDVTSAICVRYPDSRFAQKVAGDNPTRWHVARTHADEVTGWTTTPPDENAGFLHSSITTGVALSARIDELHQARQTLEDEFGGEAVLAAAFRAGNAVIASVIPGYRAGELPPVQDTPGRVAAILGVGNGVLRATVGAYHPGANEFVGAWDVHAAEAALFADLAVEFPNTPRL